MLVYTYVDECDCEIVCGIYISNRLHLYICRVGYIDSACQIYSFLLSMQYVELFQNNNLTL